MFSCTVRFIRALLFRIFCETLLAARVYRTSTKRRTGPTTAGMISIHKLFKARSVNESTNTKKLSPRFCRTRLSISLNVMMSEFIVVKSSPVLYAATVPLSSSTSFLYV